jgi:acyl carrier protein
MGTGSNFSCHPSHYCCEIVMSEVNQELQNEVAGLIVSALNLDISLEEIQSDAPLYGDGLGLDSIDILEVALVVSKRFGFQLRSDNADNVSIFSSLNNLTQHIAANRTK